jgi:hypothetical protein
VGDAGDADAATIALACRLLWRRALGLALTYALMLPLALPLRLPLPVPVPLMVPVPLPLDDARLLFRDDADDEEDEDDEDEDVSYGSPNASASLTSPIKVSEPTADSSNTCTRTPAAHNINSKRATEQANVQATSVIAQQYTKFKCRIVQYCNMAQSSIVCKAMTRKLVQQTHTTSKTTYPHNNKKEHTHTTTITHPHTPTQPPTSTPTHPNTHSISLS